jgi:hypothetical protein
MPEFIAKTIKSLEKTIGGMKLSFKEEQTALEDKYIASIESLRQEKHSKLGEVNQQLDVEQRAVKV